MNAEQIVERVRSIGGRIEVRGGRLHIEAPKGTITPELREALTTHKDDIIKMGHKPTDSAAELHASMCRLEAARISLAIWEDGSMRVIELEVHSRQAQSDGGTVYTPKDMYAYVTLRPHERRMLHEFIRRFNGATTWRCEGKE